MFLPVPIPGAQEAIHWYDIAFFPDQNTEVPIDVSVSLHQCAILDVLEIPVYLILEFPEFRFIIMFILLPRFDCFRGR
jgi:hypothetical protein